MAKYMLKLDVFKDVLGETVQMISHGCSELAMRLFDYLLARFV